MGIAIIGAGNGGCALAAWLAFNGQKVTLYGAPGHTRKIEAIHARGGLLMQGEKEALVTTIKASSDLEQAIGGAHLILVTVPSYAQDEQFRLIAPLLQDGQAVVFLPGNFATLRARQLLDEQGGESKRVHFFESITFPVACRATNEATVSILGVKQILHMASLNDPAPPDDVRVRVEAAMPGRVSWCRNVLEVGLQCLNGVVHPATAILNMGRIEDTQGDFYFYRQGMSRSVSNILEKIDAERIELGHRLGLRLPRFVDVLHEFYGTQFSCIREFAEKSQLHNQMKVCPSTSKHRYITEDIPYILVPWLGIGQLIGFEAEATRSIVSLASLINHEDYFSTGRNPAKLGLSSSTDVRALAH